MNKLLKIFKELMSPKHFAWKIQGVLLETFAPFISDRLFLKMKWKRSMKYTLNLDNPVTFNEKLQWLKLNDRRPEYTQMVDKVEAKKYAERLIGREHIIPTLAVYNKVEDIDFSTLPKQFVLKCTHDSGGIVICKNKDMLDKDTAIKKLRKGIKQNFYYQNREWPYKDVKPRIIAEQYMTDNGNELQDYKIYCFNGVPKVILVCKNRFKETGLSEDFFSLSWEHLDVTRPFHPNSDEGIHRPAELDEILRLSKKLSVGKTFVRTDFYIINHEVYFGEITFYPASGLVPFCPETFDELLGSWIKLPVGG